jgi:hypothetical protein
MNRSNGADASRIAALVLAFFGWVGGAPAQQPTQAQVNAIRQACRGDYQTYCASVPAGGSAALACLTQNAQSLSPPCQRAVKAVGAAPRPHSQAPAAAAPPTAEPAAPYQAPGPPLAPRQELGLIRRACGPDFRAYCAGVPAGGGRILACLQANGPYLSRPCRSALIAARQGG